MGQPAKKAPRLMDVAKLAGVSTSLVSRVLNNDPSLHVRDETRASVLSAVRMLDYTPHMSARALRNARTGLLGFALHHVNDPIYADLVERAQAEATGRGYSIILVNTDEIAARGDHFRAMVQGHRVDGLLIQSGFGTNEELLRSIARSIPSVVFGSGPVDDLRTLRLDDQRAARMATEHLIDAGHTAIAFVGAAGLSASRRYEGYLAALADAGLPALPSVNGGWTSDDAHGATVQLLASIPVTGVVAVTTTTALGVHSGIVAAGRAIPDDVSLVSVHDAWFARHLNPPLTVVSLPIREVGTLGVTMLLEQIDRPTTGETVLDEPGPELVIRGSTAAPRRIGTP